MKRGTDNQAAQTELVKIFNHATFNTIKIKEVKSFPYDKRWLYYKTS